MPNVWLSDKLDLQPLRLPMWLKLNFEKDTLNTNVWKLVTQNPVVSNLSGNYMLYDDVTNTSQTMTGEILFWTSYLVSFPSGGARISQLYLHMRVWAFRQGTSRFMHPHVAMQPSSLLRHLQFALLHPIAQLHVIRSVHDFGMLSFENQAGTYFSSTRCHPPVASGFGRLSVGLFYIIMCRICQQGQVVCTVHMVPRSIWRWRQLL